LSNYNRVQEGGIISWSLGGSDGGITALFGVCLGISYFAFDSWIAWFALGWLFVAVALFEGSSFLSVNDYQDSL
jgi:hypothetical protein